MEMLSRAFLATFGAAGAFALGWVLHPDPAPVVIHEPGPVVTEQVFTDVPRDVEVIHVVNRWREREPIPHANVCVVERR